MEEVDHVLENIKFVKERIRKSCEKAGRDPKEVKLLLATKTVTSERIIEALKDGNTLIGENKIQEVKEKYEDLKSVPHTMHFIGHLQTNKIKEILKYNVNLVESVDRMELAEKLDQRLKFEKRELDVFIQVNTSAEESKFGVAPELAIDLVKQVATLSSLHIKGLMTIGLFSAETEKVRKCFQLLKRIQEEVKQLQLPNVEMNELSMGMSGDMETAIEEGATIIRVGTAVFGKRIYPDSYYWNEEKK